MEDVGTGTAFPGSADTGTPARRDLLLTIYIWPTGDHSGHYILFQIQVVASPGYDAGNSDCHLDLFPSSQTSRNI